MTHKLAAPLDEKYKMIQNILLDNVPLFVDHIEKRGGAQDVEWEWLADPDSEIRELLDYADSKLLYEKDEDEFWKSIEILVRAISILSFLPGGVRIFNLSFHGKTRSDG